MNASSKGHLPSVHLLLKRGADPLARNKFGETAFDLAAGVFEVRICEVLGSYEKIAWSARREKGRREGKELDEYSVCGIHSTVPVVLYENQRLVTPTLSKFSTLSGMLGGEEKWTAKVISRNDRRAAFTLPTSILEGIVGEEDGEGEERACFKSEVGLPVVGKESKLIVPERREVRSGGRVKIQESNNTTIKQKGKTTATKSSASSSLSTVLSSSSTEPSPTSSIAVTSQGTPAWVWLSNWTVDLSSPFSSPQDGWSYSQSFTTPNDEWLPSLPLEGTGNARKWIRRRRWVRVMRRRVDLANWGYLDSPTQATIGGDYRSRAEFLIDQNGEDEEQDLGSSTGSLDGTRTRKSLARLERAADELRSGMEEDEDQERKRAAQSDLEVVLGKIALLKSQLGEEREENENDEGELLMQCITEDLLTHCIEKCRLGRRICLQRQRCWSRRRRYPISLYHYSPFVRPVGLDLSRRPIFRILLDYSNSRIFRSTSSGSDTKSRFPSSNKRERFPLHFTQ